jgi:hypothetical protein
MPHLSANSQLKKISYSVFLSTLSAMYAAVIPTMCGGLAGSYILSRDLKQDDLFYDMKISAASMAAFGMLSYPYQNCRDYPPIEHIVKHHIFITCTIFIIVPLILPLIVNKMTREKDFPEWISLGVGGLFAQLITLIFILVTIEIGLRNETFVKTLDYLEELIIPAEEENVVQLRVVRNNIHESVFDTMLKKSHVLAEYFQKTFTTANARLAIRHMKLAMMRPVLKYLLNVWQAEHSDPYSKYFLIKIANPTHDAIDYMQQIFSDLDQKTPIEEDKLEDEKKYEATPAIINIVKLNIPKRRYEVTRIKFKIAKFNLHSRKAEKKRLKFRDYRKKKREKTPPKLNISTPILSASPTPNIAAFFQPPAPNVEAKSPDSCMQLTLTKVEKQVFDLLDLLVFDSNHTYKSYIVGGWAYDRIREIVKGIPPCMYNDIDIVTEIPPHILAGLFIANPHVKGLFTSKWFGKQLEIMHEADLSDLLCNAKTRDFNAIYIDKTGKVSDPLEYELINLRLGLLYTSRPPETMFKDDPLMILRAIYKASKRKLNFEVWKGTIIADSMTLFSGLQDINAGSEKMLNPHVMNLLIAKLFSQKLAKENFEILFELGIFAAIFPTIYTHMFHAIEWIREQIEISAKLPWPKLAMIYATFIAPAIVHQNPILEYYRNNDELNVKDNIIDPDIIYLVEQVGRSSPLIKDAFKDPEELYNYLREPLSLYCEFCNNKILLQNLNVMTSPTMRF